MAKFPIYEEMARDVANMALDEIEYRGRTIRQWIDAIAEQPEVIYCKDCAWWTKQDDSLQGRCALFQIYPTGGWFFGSAERREVTE